MIISIDKEHIYNLFGVTDFISLEMAIDIMAPSLLDYHFSDFFKYGEEILFFNKREIENSFYLGNYSLYLDYNENLFLEIDKLEAEDSTSSFW